MRIKLDENLPQSLAGKLRALGHDVDTNTKIRVRAPRT